MAAYRRVYDSRLTAKNQDQLRKPTLSNRLWATFFCNTVGVQNCAGSRKNVPTGESGARSVCIFEAKL